MAAVPERHDHRLHRHADRQDRAGRRARSRFSAPRTSSGYLDKYSIEESIEDETTLPIKHIMAPSEMTVPADRLDKEFFDLADAEGVTDIEELNKVLDRAVGLRTFLKADDRVEKVAAFVAEHFQGKRAAARLQGLSWSRVDREACAKYKRALDKLLPPEWTEAVYTENAADVVDRPLVAELQLDRRARGGCSAAVQEGGPGPENPDRHGQAADRLRRAAALLHVSRQADARPRAASGDRTREPALCRRKGMQKTVGLVVDFVGVLRELKKALAIRLVGCERRDRGPRSADARISSKRSRKPRADYLDAGEGGDADERLNASSMGGSLTGPAKAFFESYKDIENLWEILSPSTELAITSGRSSAWRSSMPPYGTPMPRRSASSPILPTRPGGSSKRVRRKRALAA